MAKKDTTILKSKRAAERKNKFMHNIIGNSTWIPILAVVVLYLSSGLLVFLGIFKLYIIIYEFVLLPDLYHQVDLIRYLAEFIGIIEVYLLAIIFKIFSIGIYTLFVGEVMQQNHKEVYSIEEMKVELAKIIILFLAVFMTQKIVAWDDGIQTLYYGLITTMTCGVLIVFTIVIQRNISRKNIAKKPEEEKTP